MIITKTIFFSSTIYDLAQERKYIKNIFEESNGLINFKCLLNEEPDFAVTPKQLGSSHSYEICLDNVLNSDFVIMLINKRYNKPIIKDDGEYISIVHKEYRMAHQQNIPIYIFINKKTWNARNRHKKGMQQKYVSPNHLGLFKLIDEIVQKQKNNWLFIYTDRLFIGNVIKNNIFQFDDSVFVDDVTIPDGTIIKANSEFEKIWEIRNNGFMIWEDRFLKEDNPGASFIFPHSNIIPIPKTLPGQNVKLSVKFKAYHYPCTTVSWWKMVDQNGKYFFRNKLGLGCKVKIV